MQLMSQCLSVQVAFWTWNHRLLFVADVICKQENKGQRDEIISYSAVGGWWCCGWYGG